MSKQINWSSYIKEALDRTEFMAISTVTESGSWVCPVQFSYDEKLNFYPVRSRMPRGLPRG